MAPGTVVIVRATESAAGCTGRELAAGCHTALERASRPVIA
jgi:hypothetical protein